MAHIVYCLRYMHRQGFDAEITMERYGGKLDTLLRMLIENGKGIELNVSDLVPGGHDAPGEHAEPLLKPVFDPNEVARWAVYAVVIAGVLLAGRMMARRAEAHTGAA